ARRANTACAQLEAAHVQNREGDVMSLPDFSEYVLDWHLAVIKNEWASRGAPDAHLVLFRAHRKAREIALDDEGGELLSAHLSKHDEQVCEACVGNPHLLAIQEVVL